MATFMVVFSITNELGSVIDSYVVFRGDDFKNAKKKAKRYYKKLLKKEDNLYSASITKVVKSTDYE